MNVFPAHQLLFGSWSAKSAPCKECGKRPEFEEHIKQGGYAEPCEDFEGGFYGPTLYVGIGCGGISERCLRHAVGTQYTDDMISDMRVKYKTLKKMVAVLSDWWNEKQK